MNADRERTPFAELVQRFLAGDPAALAELYASYNPVIREAVRRRLPAKMRLEFDSIDFAQDVWAAVCRLPRNRHHFESPAALQGFLVEIAANKVIDAFRKRTAQRDFGTKQAHALDPIAAPEPTPSQWAIAGERWASIAAELPASHVAIIERLREGYTQEEVAGMTGISMRTVSRIVQRVQRICEVSS